MPEISLDRVFFSYTGGVDVYPEPGLTLALEPGVTALVGENGAGKTTLTKLLIGLLRPKSGDIEVAGHDVSKMTVAEMAKTVGYTFQNPDDQLFERTVKAEVNFGPRVLKKPPADRERGVATLGQDYLSRERLRDLVMQLGARGNTVLVVTHDMDFVGESCATTVVLSHGEVRYAGQTSNAFGDRALLKEAGLEPPHVTDLAHAIGLRDCVSDAEFLATWRQSRT